MLRLSDWVSVPPSEHPPQPMAVWAPAGVAPTLLARLAEREEAELRDLRLLHAAQGVVVLGPAAALPWCDGVTYLATTQEAPGLFLPLHERPCAPLDVVARALVARLGHDGPVMLLRAPLTAASLTAARAVQRAALVGLAEGAP
jgi:hypothetical protein